MANVRIGIIGYGSFGRFLHQAWQKLDQVEVIAVAKRSLTPGSLGKIRVYNDWQELLHQPDLDLIAITTPPSDHVHMAIAAMRAGKHVLIEKPLALTASTGKEVIRVRNETKRVAGVNHLLRFNPIIKALIDLTRKGVLGTLLRADVENYASDEGLPPDHWFWDKEISGGILVEHAVHFIDIINQLTTEGPKEITAFSHWRNQNQEDRVITNILYSRGLMATHYHLFARPAEFEDTSIRLSYTRAQIDILGWVPLQGTITLYPDQKSKDEPVTLPKLIEPKQEVYADCARSLLADLIQKIKSPQHELEVPLEDALRALEIAEAGAILLKSHPASHTTARL